MISENNHELHEEDGIDIITHTRQVVTKKQIIIIALELCVLLYLFMGPSLSSENDSFNPSVYNETALLDQLTEQLMYRPMSYYQIKKRAFTSKAFLAYRLYLNSQNPIYHKIQYRYYDKYYQIGSYPQQIPFCIISPGRNLYSRGKFYEKYLKSLEAQNYTNYRVILIDDFSDDVSVEKIQEFLDKEVSQEFRAKVKLIANTERKYSLANKDYAIRNECKQNEYVLDLDADDSLIGRQALKLLSAIYQKHPQYWLMHTNDISYYENLLEPQISQSHQIPKNIFDQQIIRLYTFSITNPRTFRRQLYMIINPKQFVNPATGKFWQWTSDKFIYNSLLELAGFEHSHYIDEIIYYYNRDQQFKYTQEKLQTSIKGRLETPFMALQDLNEFSQAKRDPSFNLTEQQIIQQTKQAQKYYLDTLKAKTYTPQKKQIIAKYIQKMKTTPANIQNVTKLVDNIQQGDVYITNYLVENNFYLEFLVVQRFYIEKEYEEKVDEKALLHEETFCVLVDIESRNQFNMYFYHFFISIAQQRYTNLKAIVTINYNMTEEEKKHLNFYLERTYPHMLNKTFFIFNEQPKTKAENRHHSITQYCDTEDYVMPLTLSGQIVGSYFLYLFNFLHQGKQQNTTVPLVYANQIAVEYIDQQIGLKHIFAGGAKQSQIPYNIDDHIVTIEQQKLWVDFYPFSFKKQLYEKLKNNYICLDRQDCRNGMTDSFLFKAVLELSEGNYGFQNTMLFYRKFERSHISEQQDLELLKTIKVVDYLIS